MPQCSYEHSVVPCTKCGWIPPPAVTALREAALGVVMNWDMESTQHGTMGALRVALGLLRERPTREEAVRRALSFGITPQYAIAFPANALRGQDIDDGDIVVITGHGHLDGTYEVTGYDEMNDAVSLLRKVEISGETQQG